MTGVQGGASTHHETGKQGEKLQTQLRVLVGVKVGHEYWYNIIQQVPNNRSLKGKKLSHSEYTGSEFVLDSVHDKKLAQAISIFTRGY